MEDLLLYCFHLRSLLLETTLGSFFVVRLCDFLAAEIQGKFVILEDFWIELALEDLRFELDCDNFSALWPLVQGTLEYFEGRGPGSHNSLGNLLLVIVIIIIMEVKILWPPCCLN